jgi:hypothetical protein
VRRTVELDLENRRLRAELARASSPDRVSALSAHKNLQPPLPGQIQYVEAPSARKAKP